MLLEAALRDVIASVVRAEVRAALKEEREHAVPSSPPLGSTEYVSVREAAKVADVHEATIRSWLRQGRLPQHRAGRHYRIKAVELRALLDGPSGAATPAVQTGDAVEARAKRVLASLSSRTPLGGVRGPE